MSDWQNLELAKFDNVTSLGIPIMDAVTELPDVDKFIEFDYCSRVINNRDKTAVHFFEYDYKFEKLWTNTARYAKMLQEFAYVIGPDFSVYSNFPYPIKIYNYYRNAWLTKYLTEVYNISVVPLVMWGEKDTWDWCFDCYPKNSIVAVSNIGSQKLISERSYFLNGYNEMLKRLTPSKVLLFTRSHKQFDGNVKYIYLEAFKGEQSNG